MKTVGIRNRKNQLSKYIGYVREGDIVLVTDRDQVVAQLVAPGPPWSAEPGSPERRALVRLAAKGRVVLGQRGKGPRPALPPLAATVDLDGLLAQTRRERS